MKPFERFIFWTVAIVYCLGGWMSALGLHATDNANRKAREKVFELEKRIEQLESHK